MIDLTEPEFLPERLMPSKLNGPQRVAIVLAQLDATRSGKLLAAMSESEVVDVMAAMATLPVLDHNQVTEVLTDFTAQASALLQVGQGGMDVARKLLHERLGDARADEVLEQLAQGSESHPLAFLRRLDATQIALAVAPKGVHEDIRQKFVRNLSHRAAADLVADIECLGPTRLSEVEAAQSAVVRVVRDLDTAGEIILGRDEEFV